MLLIRPILGIYLPLLAVVVESLLGLQSEYLFNPMPTPLHLLLEPIGPLEEHLINMLPEQWTFTRQPSTSNDLPARGAARLWAATQPATTARYKVLNGHVPTIESER